MKIKTVGILLWMSCTAVLLPGCGKEPSATQVAEESEETEKEGTGEDAETEAAIREAEKKEQAEEESADPVSDHTEDVPPRGLAGIFLQDEDDAGDREDGMRLADGFAAKNCETFICYSKKDAEQQVRQIEESVGKNPQILVIDPVDPYSLTDVLAEAAQKEISVFSYDDLIMQSPDVSYYIAFDMRGIGQQIGRRIIDKKDLKKLQSENGQAAIEFFMGAEDDLGALFLFNGILEELMPYLEDGTLVCPSGQLTFAETSVKDFSQEIIADRFRQILKDHYAEGGCPDILCTGFDQAVGGILSVLDESEIYPGTEGYPLINGVGCEADVIRAIAEDRVSFDIYLDREELSELCVSMADTILSGEKPEVNNYEQYDNGTRLIRTNMVSGEFMDEDNYEMLIDMGLFTEEEVAPVYEAPPVIPQTQISLFPRLGERLRKQEDSSLETE